MPKKLNSYIIIILFFACASAPAACQESFEIKTIKKHNETQLTITLSDGKVHLIYFDETHDSDKIRFLIFKDICCDRGTPIEKQLLWVEALLNYYFKKEGKADYYYFRMPFYNEMRPRLIAAAAASENWDKQRGEPRKGLINEVVKNLMNEHEVYLELKEFFAHIDYDISLVSIEKASKFVFSINSMVNFGIVPPKGAFSKKDRFPTKVAIDAFELKKR